MFRYRRILEMHSEGISIRSIAASTGNSRQKITEVIRKAEEKGITRALSEEMTDQWLGEFLFPEKQLEANNELLNDHIKLEINKDFQNSNLAKKKIEVYERALEQATENYRITKNKYDNGLSNITDLLDADAALVGAKVNVINAKADATLANKKLLQSSGILK